MVCTAAPEATRSTSAKSSGLSPTTTASTICSSLRDDTDVPEAVSGVIRGACRGLPELTRDLLRIAAVAGTEFTAARLAASPLDAARTIRGPRAGSGRRSHRRHYGRARQLPVQPWFGARRGGRRDHWPRPCRPARRDRATYASDDDGTASQDAIDAAQHAHDAGHELDPVTALLLIDRARADAWSRCAYREVAELDRRALDACARMSAGSARFDREVDLRLQLASVEAVVSGQSSARVLADLCHSAQPEQDAVQSMTAWRWGAWRRAGRAATTTQPSCRTACWTSLPPRAPDCRASVTTSGRSPSSCAAP